MEAEPAPRSFRGVTGGEDQLGVLVFYADAVVAYLQVEETILGTGLDPDVWGLVESLLCGQIVDGFHRILDQVDQHLVNR